VPRYVSAHADKRDHDAKRARPIRLDRDAICYGVLVLMRSAHAARAFTVRARTGSCGSFCCFNTETPSHEECVLFRPGFRGESVAGGAAFLPGSRQDGTDRGHQGKGLWLPAVAQGVALISAASPGGTVRRLVAKAPQPRPGMQTRFQAGGKCSKRMAQT
jgi:hypothetical protein